MTKKRDLFWEHLISQEKQDTFLQADFMLSATEIMSAINHQSIYLFGNYYEVPKKQLVDALSEMLMGNLGQKVVRLSLKKIEP